MTIYYQSTDITNMVQTRDCIFREASGGRLDSLELVFENAAGWYRWGPQEDDEIVVNHNAYDTGTMYLNTILPEDNSFRIIATSLPCRARKRVTRSYVEKTLGDIMRACAVSDGMDYRLYGIESEIVIPYIEQNDESSAAFLNRLMTLEGGVLKIINGRYTAIGIEYAQALTPHQIIKLDAEQRNSQYQRSGQSWKTATLMTPWATVTATDKNVREDHPRVVLCNYPARNSAQAGRWARGLLLNHNRQCERLRIESDFNQGFVPMTRIDVESTTDAQGEWLIEDVEHDFINLASTANMCRCVTSII